MTEHLPNAISEGSFTIAGIEVKTFVLDDGRRIIDMHGANRLIKWIEDGGKLTDEDAINLLLLKEGRTVMENFNATKESDNG